MRQRLSSSWTPFYKFIFPLAWLGGFGIVVVVLLVKKAPEWPAWALAMLVGAVVVLRLALLLKTVEMDADVLYVSNYRMTVAVPPEKVVAIREIRYLNIRPVWLMFDVDTPFGRAVMFMPRQFKAAPWRPHPDVELLRSRAGLARLPR